MMLRIIFTGLATCVLLLAAGVRFAREDAPPRVREALGSAVERAIESAKQALPGPPAQASREPAQEAPAPAPSTAASPPRRRPLRSRWIRLRRPPHRRPPPRSRP